MEIHQPNRCALADDARLFSERMLVRSGEMGKSRASALGVDWTCSPRNARYLLVETSLYKEILIHQDCYRHSGDQENGTRND
jgi:hypothetical protein